MFDIKELHNRFNLIANPDLAKGAEAYMKNQFKYFGIYTNERRQISSDYIKEVGMLSKPQLVKTIKQLYKQEYREFQYIAFELLAHHKKMWDEDIIDIAEFCIITKSWWDTVDNIASLVLTDYFKMHPHQIKPITQQWNKSKNIWLQRSSIMFQKAFKKNTNTELLSQYILNLAGSKEFFVQKAIGWALREYAKTNANWVIDFVASNPHLPALSKREALKHLNNNKI